MGCRFSNFLQKQSEEAFEFGISGMLLCIENVNIMKTFTLFEGEDCNLWETKPWEKLNNFLH